MADRVDLIKGLIMQNEIKSRSKRGDKKQASKLLVQIKKIFNDVLKEDDDNVFEGDIIRLLSSPAANSYISSNFFPQNLSEYGRYRNIIEYTSDLRLELRWMIYCLHFYSKEISTFVREREKYDDFILLNQYEEALKVVEGIEKSFGPSLWSLECKFYLFSNLDLDKNDLMKEIPETIFGAVMNFYELKNRNNVTSDEYFYIANKEINIVKKYFVDAEYLVEFYAYKISSLEYELDEDKILQIIGVIRQTSLIDRYLFLVDVCDYIVTLPENDALRTMLKKYVLLLDEIEDDHLIAVRFILDNTENRKRKYTPKTRLDHAKCEFIKGNILEAREEAVDLLQKFPNNIGAMNLYIESNILLGNDMKICEDKNLGVLLKNLTYVYTLNENRDESLEVVRQLANACSQSTWSKEILNNIIYHCQTCDEQNYKKAEILSNLQHLDIETVIACLGKEKNINFIEQMIKEDDLYVRFRNALLNEEYDNASRLCGIDQIKDLIVVYNKNTSITEKIKHLRKIQGKDASIAIMAMSNFLASIDLNTYLEVAMKLSTGLIIDNIYTSLFIPLEKIVNYIEQSGEDIRVNICTPILYYVYATYFNKEKFDDLGIICEDFFLFRDIERPTKMDIYNQEYEREELIYFLKNVCSTKIMDISISSFENSQERDKERVEICNILTQIDPDNSREYENEIREVTQKLMINAELKIIEENRIHVNVDGMKDRLEKAYKSDFVRYQFYQDERIKQVTMVLDGDAAEKLHIIQNTPERILKELILHIRDAFVSSDEYGLNGYLSLNIRHGTLEDELRSPLNKSYLNTKKDIHTGKYVLHPHWENYAYPQDLNVIEKAITDFHIKTEAIISKLKGTYIQIRTEEKVTDGIFDYRLDDWDYLNITLQIQESATFEEFLDIVINHLWQITERNLCEIKKIIKNEVAQDYNNAFEELKVAISKIRNKTQLRDLQQKIAEASTDMPNTLDKICYWFQRSTESKHNDFDLQFAFNLGLQTIKNMHPEKRFIAKALKPVESEKIPGWYLKNFDGIFYNLFDNIYKKAISSDGINIEIRYELRYKEQKFYIYIENDYNCATDILDDELKVEQAKELIRTGKYLERVKGEGGTGIPKIVKIIAYDLKKIPDIDFGYIKERNIFFMKIKF